MIRFFLKRNYTIFIALCCCLLMLSACATTSRTEKSIEARVTARWDTLLAGDLAGAYEFLSPGYRSSVSSLQYQRSLLIKRVQWKGARYIRSECKEITCKVAISLDYVLHGALPGVTSFDGTQTVYESWVLADGQWYFVPET
jgi:hypothetical protein